MTEQKFEKFRGDPAGLLVPEGYMGNDPVPAPGVIVANRLLDSKSPGGLVSTLGAAAAGSPPEQRIVSIGWDGEVERGGLEVILPPMQNGEQFDTVHVSLSEDEI